MAVSHKTPKTTKLTRKRRRRKKKPCPVKWKDEHSCDSDSDQYLPNTKKEGSFCRRPLKASYISILSKVADFFLLPKSHKIKGPTYDHFLSKPKCRGTSWLREKSHIHLILEPHFQPQSITKAGRKGTRAHFPRLNILTQRKVLREVVEDKQKVSNSLCSSQNQTNENKTNNKVLMEHRTCDRPEREDQKN